MPSVSDRGRVSPLVGEGRREPGPPSLVEGGGVGEARAIGLTPTSSALAIAIVVAPALASAIGLTPTSSDPDLVGAGLTPTSSATPALAIAIVVAPALAIAIVVAPALAGAIGAIGLTPTSSATTIGLTPTS